MIDAGDEAALRVAGRKLINDFAGALRSIKLYPVENAVVQGALKQLCETIQGIAAAEGEVELRASREFLFVNETRLRLDLDNYVNF